MSTKLGDSLEVTRLVCEFHEATAVTFTKAALSSLPLSFSNSPVQTLAPFALLTVSCIISPPEKI